MRRWAEDKIRLALRKVLPRLIAFAILPTRKEVDQIIAGAMAELLKATNTPAPTADRSRQANTLH